MNEIIEIDVVVMRELSPYREQTNWGMYAVEPLEEYSDLEINDFGNIVVSGITPRLELKREYKLQIAEKDRYKGNMTYEIRGIKLEVPTTIEGQRSFLKTLLTELQVEAIFTAYPDQDILQKFRDDSLDHKKIKGIGDKTLRKIHKKVLDNIEFQDALAHLGKYDIGYNFIMKLVDHFGSTALLIQNIEKNPYCLTVVHGIGFDKADKVARKMGYDMKSPHRIKSAIKYVIEKEESNGHTYITQKQLLINTEELLNVESDLIFDCLHDCKELIIIDDKIALEKTYNQEVYIAQKLKSILNKSTMLDFDIEDFIVEQEKLLEIKLTDQQKSFFSNIKYYNINFLVGYAGCGKSQMQKLLINLLDKLSLTYRLIAPTGKATKVLAKYTNREVSTIHRAIGLGKDQRDGQILLEEDFIIIDETSMLDVYLAASTLRKIVNPNVRILFIGDPFQIPSVSCGNFLYDMVESQVFPTTKLDIVFRQSEGGILDLATKIRKQERFINDSYFGIKEFGVNAVIASVPQEKMVGGYKYYVKELLNKYGIEDIMILSPTKKRDLGTFAVNNEVQSIVNPPDTDKNEIKYGSEKNKTERVYRECDNIINIKNTYEVEAVSGDKVDIVNGDTGVIKEIDMAFKEMIIDYGFDEVPISFSELENILHSYCITMHKSQGSSSRAVIVIMDKSHKYQLNANLVYTAWTRPEDFLVVLCQADVINYAMRKVENLQRNTFMRKILWEME